MRENFGIYVGRQSNIGAAIGNDTGRDELVEVRDGQTLALINNDSEIKEASEQQTALRGEVTLGTYEGRPSAFIRIIYGMTPKGPKGPMCMCAIAPLKEGTKVESQLQFLPVKRFYEGCETQNY
jgi:hypothetical protein